MKNLYYGQIEEIKKIKEMNTRKEAYKMEKIIDRENKEAVKALERADYVETISGLRKPEAKKIKAAV